MFHTFIFDDKDTDISALKQILLKNDFKFATPSLVNIGHKLITVNCFGTFTCFLDKKNSPIKWRTQKTLELFALLIHYQGKGIRKEKLIETLWPDEPSPKTNNLFYTTCNYIRKTFEQLGFNDILIHNQHLYSINITYLNCDLLNFQKMCDKMQYLNIQELNKLSLLYTGEYFENSNYEWTFEKAIWLSSIFNKIQYQISDYYIKHNYLLGAIEAIEKIIKFDPYNEEAIHKLTSLYLQNKDKSSAVTVYTTYEKLLKNSLNLLPSPYIKALIDNYNNLNLQIPS